MNLDAKLFAAGGFMIFAGGTDPLRAGLEGALLSGAIDLFTHSDLSHCGIVPPAPYWPENAPWLIESTIWQKISGPQYNRLQPRLEQDYQAKGGHAWLLPFRPQFAPAWPTLWDHAQQMFALVSAGKLHYSVKRLFSDACERSLVLGDLPMAGLIERLAEKDAGVVCSECAGLLMQAGGVDREAEAAGLLWLPNVEPVAGQPIGCGPVDLRDMPLWLPAEQVL